MGKWTIGQNSIVHNMLFIPQLKCNMISLAQLMDDVNYFVIFSTDLYVIQDRISRCRLKWVIKRMRFSFTDH